MSNQRLAEITGFRLITGDPDRLVRFYAGTLGFERLGEAEPIDPVELAAIGLRGGGTRWRLRIGGQTLSIDRLDIAGRPMPADGDAASPWFQHFALVVPDIAAAFDRLASTAPISRGGPQHLPPASGGADAFKFRDPDGHPLELLQFPADATPARWADRRPEGRAIALGIDHSAIGATDLPASLEFYRHHGLRPGEATLNRGPAQQALDGLDAVEVDVVPLLPDSGSPHVELLHYRNPRPGADLPIEPNDVAATRFVWSGANPTLLADPDGHLHEIAPDAAR